MLHASDLSLTDKAFEAFGLKAQAFGLKACD